MLRVLVKLKWRSLFKMNKRGILGGFISMFFATIVIVIILMILIVGSGIVKKVVRDRDNIGVYNETASGIDDVFDYADEQFYNVTRLRGYVDYRFDDMAQLRVIVRSGGRWEDWLEEEMGR